jgi:hypothetical protein
MGGLLSERAESCVGSPYTSLDPKEFISEHIKDRIYEEGTSKRREMIKINFFISSLPLRWVIPDSHHGFDFHFLKT